MHTFYVTGKVELYVAFRVLARDERDAVSVAEARLEFSCADEIFDMSGDVKHTITDVRREE